MLPEWKATLRELRIPERLLPRDVRTRWNSTYDMLDTAVRFRKAIDRMCGDKKNKLRSYELSKEEWEIARQLREILKVRHPMLAPTQIAAKPTPTKCCGSVPWRRLAQHSVTCRLLRSPPMSLSSPAYFLALPCSQLRYSRMQLYSSCGARRISPRSSPLWTTSTNSSPRRGLRRTSTTSPSVWRAASRSGPSTSTIHLQTSR